PVARNRKLASSAIGMNIRDLLDAGLHSLYRKGDRNLLAASAADGATVNTNSSTLCVRDNLGIRHWPSRPSCCEKLRTEQKICSSWGYFQVGCTVLTFGVSVKIP
ncbi:MAG: hypothetical protein KDI27_09500, partial [Gammaproteobacteria bacterium]|nr:hypothetical protein [Gammaproteobacteria bacterium]